jgi:hypothetical protein
VVQAAALGRPGTAAVLAVPADQAAPMAVRVLAVLAATAVRVLAVHVPAVHVPAR